MDVRLDNRTALITGGSLGLGRAMAMEFARSGASVAILSRTQSTLEEAAAEIAEAAPDATVRPYACDVREAEAITEAHAAVVSDLGPVDILVNNAGTSAAMPFEDISDDDWYHDFNLKVMAAVRLNRLCIPAMKDNGWGRIINVLNTAAKAPPARSAPTSVSRAAGMALSKALAAELAPHGILVNSLNTGILVTDQWHKMHERRAPEKTFEDFLDSMGGQVPVGPDGPSLGIRKPGLFPGLRSGLVHHRNSHQRRRWHVPGRVGHLRPETFVQDEGVKTAYGRRPKGGLVLTAVALPIMQGAEA